MALDPELYDLERFDKDLYAAPGEMTTKGLGIGSLLSSLFGAAGWLSPALGGLSSILGLWSRHGAEKEAEERQRKREALQRAILMSRSFEEAGRRWGY